MSATVRDLLQWLHSLAQDSYPEDRLIEGDENAPLRGVVFCWMPNAGARRMAQERGANVIVAHEGFAYQTPRVDPACPPPEEWQVNRDMAQYYAAHRIAAIRCHRTLDAFCVPRVLGEQLGFPPPAVHEGHKGYEFTLVYDLPPRPFGDLARELKARLGLPFVRASAGPAERTVSRVGLGWGGVSLSANLQYMERLRRHGVQVVIGGEVDEYALEYYRESGMEWIELGHYATEIAGIEHASRQTALHFPGVPVACYRDTVRLRAIV